MSPSQNLASRIAMFFSDFNMLGGATLDEMYEALWKAFEYHDEEQIRIVKDYFSDIRWTNEKAQDLYRQIDLYYS